MENPIKMDDLEGNTIFGNTHVFPYWRWGVFSSQLPAMFFDPGG